MNAARMILHGGWDREFYTEFGPLIEHVFDALIGILSSIRPCLCDQAFDFLPDDARPADLERNCVRVHKGCTGVVGMVEEQFVKLIASVIYEMGDSMSPHQFAARFRLAKIRSVYRLMLTGEAGGSDTLDNVLRNSRADRYVLIKRRVLEMGYGYGKRNLHRLCADELRRVLRESRDKRASSPGNSHASRRKP